MIQKNSSFSKILQKHPMIVFLSTFIFIFDPLKNLYDTSFGESSFPCRSDIMLCVRPQCVTDFFTQKNSGGPDRTRLPPDRAPRQFSCID